MEPHRTKKLHTAKETMNLLKKKSSEWGRIFDIYILDRGLIPRIDTELKKKKKKRNIKEVNDPYEK